MFPKSPSNTLARILYRDNKEVYPNLEAARSSVRSARGNNGQLHRDKRIDKTLYRKNGKAGFTI